MGVSTCDIDADPSGPMVGVLWALLSLWTIVCITPPVLRVV